MTDEITRAHSSIDRRTFLYLGVFASAVFHRLPAYAADPGRWPSVLSEAKGQIVYFHAWGGDTRINEYIAWVSRTVEARFGVSLKHVKLEDTGTAVQTVLAEKLAGNTDAGSVDLVWINGENFASMKQQGLLQTTGWADTLPNFRFVDVDGKPTTISDFTVPTEGLEAPWGMAQLVFFHDSAVLTEPPRSLGDLVDWAKNHPGRFTYPQPPDFVGSTFLKQALLDLTPGTDILSKPADNPSFIETAEPLFALLDELHPSLWRQGRAFPQSSTALRQLLADGEIDIAFAFNPAAASNAIAAGELPDTIRSFVFDGGTIGNTHFVAIPFNSGSYAAAMVVADFLMSPEAQARKEDPTVWGDPTVLKVAALAPEDRARFETLDLGIATLTPAELGRTLPEPHPTWMVRIEEEWLRRFGVQ